MGGRVSCLLFLCAVNVNKRDAGLTTFSAHDRQSVAAILIGLNVQEFVIAMPQLVVAMLARQIVIEFAFAWLAVANNFHGDP